MNTAEAIDNYAWIHLSDQANKHDLKVIAGTHKAMLASVRTV